MAACSSRSRHRPTAVQRNALIVFVISLTIQPRQTLFYINLTIP